MASTTPKVSRSSTSRSIRNPPGLRWSGWSLVWNCLGRRLGLGHHRRGRQHQRGRDGHAAGGELITAEQVDALRERFDAARGLQDFNEGAFWKFVGSTDLGALPAHRYADVLTMLDRKLKGGAK